MARGFDHGPMKDASKKTVNNYLKKWSCTEAQSHVDTAAAAFASCKSIQHEKLTKDYLVSLLIRERKD
jgi:hypothetical protein